MHTLPASATLCSPLGIRNSLLLLLLLSFTHGPSVLLPSSSPFWRNLEIKSEMARPPPLPLPLINCQSWVFLLPPSLPSFLAQWKEKQSPVSGCGGGGRRRKGDLLFFLLSSSLGPSPKETKKKTTTEGNRCMCYFFRLPLRLGKRRRGERKRGLLSLSCTVVAATFGVLNSPNNLFTTT